MYACLWVNRLYESKFKRRSEYYGFYAIVFEMNTSAKLINVSQKILFRKCFISCMGISCSEKYTVRLWRCLTRILWTLINFPSFQYWYKFMYIDPFLFENFNTVQSTGSISYSIFLIVILIRTSSLIAYI